MSVGDDVQDDLKCQRWLADSLVASLGYDAAVKVSLEMCWYGIWDLLTKDKDGHFTNAAHSRSALGKAA